MQWQVQAQQRIHNIQAILFDLDGTLIQSTGGIDRILTKWAEGLSLNVADVLSFSHGKRSIDIVRHFMNAAEVEQHYVTLTEQFIAAAGQSQAIDGAKGFIETLNNLQIPWCIVSSSERVLIQSRLAAAGLTEPSLMVAAEDIEQGKPNPEGYLRAAASMNIPIEACLVFEDAPSGVHAAQSAGAQVITVGKLVFDDYSNIQTYAEVDII